MDKDALAVLRNRTLGFVFQGFNLLPRMSLQDNVGLPLVYAGVDKEARRAGARMLEQGRPRPICRFAAQPHFRRSAAARGDRPGAGQRAAPDPRRRADRQPRQPHQRGDHGLFEELNREGITIVLVTHEQDIAAHARRQVRFLDGHIVSDHATGAGRMMLKAMLGEAWLAMGANRLRTALTMLGMVIGVGAVVIMMAIGQGAQYAVQQTISTMGSTCSSCFPVPLPRPACAAVPPAGRR
jgi:macrolide transport system ATP-binding/permease protein